MERELGMEGNRWRDSRYIHVRINISLFFFFFFVLGSAFLVCRFRKTCLHVSSFNALKL